MPRYKPIDRHPRFRPVVLAKQIQPGTIEFALDYLVDLELRLSALDARLNNDATGASAYDSRVMLKIVRPDEGQCSVASVPHGAQHRETSQQRLLLSAAESTTMIASKRKGAGSQ